MFKSIFVIAFLCFSVTAYGEETSLDCKNVPLTDQEFLHKLAEQGNIYAQSRLCLKVNRMTWLPENDEKMNVYKMVP